MTVCALIGNPNVGQETFFSKIARVQQKSDEEGNSKIDKQQGFIDKSTKIVAFPGIYSIDTNSKTENLFINYITENKVDLIINIVNASNLERNLYLTLQLTKLNIPMVVALNSVDKAKRNGIYIDIQKLSDMLGIKVIPINKLAKPHVKAVHKYIKDSSFSAPNIFPENINTEKNTYSYIEQIMNSCISVKKHNLVNISQKIDRIVLNKYLAYPIFACIIYLIFKIVFSWVGTPLSDLLRSALFDYTIPVVDKLLSHQSPWFKSLIIDGIISGISSVLVFLPVILTLFSILSFLEDSGYMNRVAFLMDRIMNMGGISGKSFMPMIIGFGCSVPALIAAKNIEDERERNITALLIPLMSCNAKLPVYMLFATMFFHGKEIIVLAFMYSMGVFIAFIYSLIFKFLVKEANYEPYIDEIPEYTLPNLKLLFMHTWEKGKGFLKKIGTIIFSMSIITWVLSNFSLKGMVNINESFLAFIGKLISPIFAPLGFGYWQNSVSLLTGLMGKEVIAGTLGVLYGGNLSVTMAQHFNTISSLSFILFILLYTPCASTIITLKKEFGTKMALISIFYQFATAWIVSFLFYNIGMRYFYGF
ncbi:ferrous iron transport protein B [Clostridium sp. PL3]|uniref:Ferrous iron transport protein B n=1 Tax=Clostridium thailandense TaxID=2794346 RepID=A0A949TSG7_9CLOT|nr:ferrous iron transport protein B [Clostridium thailandense]MBV7274542.1 ferrous iron transport protein B [Clostridium thailandense]